MIVKGENISLPESYSYNYDNHWGTSQCKLGQILNSYITPMFREHFAEYLWSCIVWSAATRKLFGPLVSTIIKTNHWRRTVKSWTCLVGPPWNHCEHIWGIIGAPVKMKSENKGLVDYVDLLARITFFFFIKGWGWSSEVSSSHSFWPNTDQEGKRECKHTAFLGKIRLDHYQITTHGSKDTN